MKRAVSINYIVLSYVLFFSQVSLIKILILDYIFGICSPTNDETDKTISVFFTGCFTDFEMAYVK